MTDLETTLKAIEAGDYDENLADLVVACQTRAQKTGSTFRWRITIGDKPDQTWDEDSLTVGEMRIVERITSSSWAEIQGPLSSAENAAAFMIAHFTKVDGLEFTEAVEKADKFTVNQIVKAVTEYQVDEPEGKDPAA